MSSRFVLAIALGVVLSDGSAVAVAGPASSGGDSCRPGTTVEAGASTDPVAAAMLRGNRALRSGEGGEALEAYREAERLALAEGTRTAALMARANAARAALDTESPEAVEARLESLVRTEGAAGAALEPSLRARLLIHAARSWERLASKREGREAARSRRRAATLLRSAESSAAASGDDRLLSYALGDLGGLYLDTARVDEARTLTRRALLLADRVLAHDALYRWHAQLSRIERRAGDERAALASARRAVAALALARSDPARVMDGSGAGFVRDVEPVYLELVDLLLRRARIAQAESRQALLSEARDTLEQLKVAEVRDHFEDACLAAQRKIKPDDVPGALVLYPVLLPDRLELILGREGKLSLHTVEVGREEVERLARELRRTLPDRTFRGYLRSARPLYEHLIRPIERGLAAAEVLVVVPSGRLRQIPFAALHDEKAGLHLIEKIAVAATPGLTLTDPRPLPAEVSQALAAGVSESVQGYVALGSVVAEIAKVSETFPSVVLLNRDFTAERFEETVEKRPIGVVHIASHGEFRAESSESFILTYAGKLSMNRLAEVISRTRLRAEDPLELLVLSACETAAGDDRAALGLAGVALQAGARSALATLWSVNDEAAGELVRRFYSEIGSGRSRAEALRAAQRSLLEDPAFAHPANWSAFMLISSWL